MSLWVSTGCPATIAFNMEVRYTRRQGSMQRITPPLAGAAIWGETTHQSSLHSSAALQLWWTASEDDGKRQIRTEFTRHVGSHMGSK